MSSWKVRWKWIWKRHLKIWRFFFIISILLMVIVWFTLGFAAFRFVLFMNDFNGYHFIWLFFLYFSCITILDWLFYELCLLCFFFWNLTVLRICKVVWPSCNSLWAFLNVNFWENVARTSILFDFYGPILSNYVVLTRKRELSRVPSRSFRSLY